MTQSRPVAKAALCLRPPRGTPKAELRRLHAAKMMGKHFRNKEPGRGYFENKLADGLALRANVSRHHPDTKCSVQKHLIMKAKRAKAAQKKGSK